MGTVTSLIVIAVLGVTLIFLVRSIFFPRILCKTCTRWEDCLVIEGAVRCSRYTKDASKK